MNLRSLNLLSLSLSISISLTKVEASPLSGDGPMAGGDEVVPVGGGPGAGAAPLTRESRLPVLYHSLLPPWDIYWSGWINR